MRRERRMMKRRRMMSREEEEEGSEGSEVRVEPEPLCVLVLMDPERL